MSLRVRIALISAAAVAIAIGIAAFVTFTATERELIAEVDASLHDRVDRIRDADNPFELVAALAFDERRSPFDRGLRGFDAVFWQFVPAGGRRLPITPAPRGCPSVLGSRRSPTA